eukprot:CAMPEP_0118698364 /NCGR_PEP_ID=MMETSP0800-20121206/15151_1 /TAXON_ID=210618 ORGANISM="Striatella unipunctata, Strain CCMP2910" /NCGR_SAMPLE_ID=MMETSP0800 /ASSEMBLY_ACC=CAM_ASM_000638 /LENGTH=652 /DNA_ID=CAMNT_0006598159 /DNA_START=23 /DNA_END=1982 /DNA_ORIENTATION=-
MILQPICPADDPHILTGFVAINLENLFADKVSGIHCVIKGNGQAYSYNVTDGMATFSGEGDFHQEDYNSLERCVVLTDNERYYVESPRYTFCMYPTDIFFESYQTNNPRVFAIGTICTIVLTSLLFLMYEFFVRRDAMKKEELLQAKRRFMRFVSHEVRTPLSAVCMGLDVLQNEISTSFGFQTTDELECWIQGHKAKAETIAEEEAETETTNELKALDAEETETVSTKTETKEPETILMSNKEALEWYEIAKDIQSNTQTSVNVLNDFLNYDKIESDTLELELTVVPIWSIIEEIFKEFKLNAEKKNIYLDLIFATVSKHKGQISVEGPFTRHTALSKEVREHKLVGDSVRISQVLRNLISNAIEFTPIHGCVSLHAKWIPQLTAEDEITDDFVMKGGSKETFKRSGTVVVSIYDTGAGISSKQIKKLYLSGIDGLQFSATDLQAGKGSGLGVHIAKGIMEQHNGTLYAESGGLGRGSSFTITFPLHHIPNKRAQSSILRSSLREAKKLEEEEEKEEEKEETQPNPLRVLVVDDAPSIRKLLCRLLEKRGFVCDQAMDGKQAVDRASESNESKKFYDAILLDYEMPEMNGPEAAKIIRGMDVDVFIVGITGNLMSEDVDYFLSCGANAVLPKPLNMKDLEGLMVEHGVVSI